jgi:hypothetical protein
MMITGITFFSLCSFTGETTTGVDADVNAILTAMGITTVVDEAALEAKYPSIKVTQVAFSNGMDVQLSFANPTAQNYNLDIYDYEGNPVASFNNIIDSKQNVPATFFNRGSYTYKLTGEGNVYAGKFFYQ